MSLYAVIDADAVISKLSLQDIAEVRSALENILPGAHAIVQGVLQTPFEKTVYADLFYLNSDYYPVNPNGMMCCRLRQGFAWADTLSVNMGGSRKDVLAEPVPVAADDYMVDAVRGLVKVDESFSGSWLKINYTAGFDNTHKPPDWLYEAVLSYLPHLIAQPTGSFDTNAMNAANEAAKRDFEVMAKIVDPYLRSSSFQFLPV